MSLSFTPLSPALGAQVTGLDLSRELPASTANNLINGLADHLVLLFRDQTLDPRRQIEFTRVFGPVEPHPLLTHRDETHPELLVLRNEPGAPGRRNDIWHTDISFAEAPPAVSVLQAKTIPAQGGDTMFCNMVQAFETLSPGMRRMLARLSAEHSAEIEIRSRGDRGQKIDAVMHPVVRQHPISGQPCLFLNPYFTRCFANMSIKESRPLIDYLAGIATMPENVYRHRWQVGDLLIWDNRATMHYAVHDYDETQSRLMHRTTAGGDPPEAWMEP